MLLLNESLCHLQVKKEGQKQRKKEAEALGDKAPPKQIPRTIENTREADVTTVDQEDEEVTYDITHDEYESYFSKTYEPKILITSSDNPHTVRQNKFSLIFSCDLMVLGCLYFRKLFISFGN